MTWAAVGVGTITALGSGYSAKQQQKQQTENERASMMANAAQIENSPWTGMKSNVMGPQGGAPDAAGAAIQGGLQGAMFGKQFGKKPVAATPGYAAPSDGIAQDPYDEYLLNQKKLVK